MPDTPEKEKPEQEQEEDFDFTGFMKDAVAKYEGSKEEGAEEPEPTDPDSGEPPEPDEDVPAGEPGPEPPEPPEPEEPDDELPPEPTDHGERSQLGRKVADMQRRFDERTATLEKQLADALEMNKALLEKVGQPSTPPEPDVDPDEPIMMTHRELQSLEERIIQKALMGVEEGQKKSKAFDDAFYQKFGALAQENQLSEEQFSAVVNESFNFNHLKKGIDPEIDAELVFSKAQNSILNKEIEALKSKRPNPLDKNKDTPKAPLGGPPASKADKQPGREPVTLDPQAEKFLGALGFSEDEKREAWKEVKRKTA